MVRQPAGKAVAETRWAWGDRGPQGRIWSEPVPPQCLMQGRIMPRSASWRQWGQPSGVQPTELQSPPAPPPQGTQRRPSTQFTLLYPGARAGTRLVQLDQRGPGSRTEWRREAVSSHTENTGFSQLPKPTSQVIVGQMSQICLYAPLPTDRVWVIGGPYQAVPSPDSQGLPGARR